MGPQRGLTFLLFTISAAGTLASKAQLLGEIIWVAPSGWNTVGATNWGPWCETDWDPRLLGACYGLAWMSLLILPNLIVTIVSFGFQKTTVATFFKNPALVAVSTVSIFTLKREGVV